ncbi:hypothetical protein CYME_CMN271C [Cyanidioschyzon merolae strain 10D]|uniref:Uncharacterized protein n=1 Tax=Cyanidioschyzon merolae (strain NIES-3377 / 10D) TaxID=280699 RepID=M1VEM5_CYAM1|nr:hypothetical protein CYME_CMN271C [Cyanidioschyzon merolae strain 10D]BAM81352.1 hypothetical protein CYME_CMN271C [Cyanidioschyzon merolae strain 10D]|eukprot:XP_005537388.1 hypothetical protein CYME_CMN271C [Cyanidioschyzon merolae strain 10D]
MIRSISMTRNFSIASCSNESLRMTGTRALCRPKDQKAPWRASYTTNIWIQQQRSSLSGQSIGCASMLRKSATLARDGGSCIPFTIAWWDSWHRDHCHKSVRYQVRCPWRPELFPCLAWRAR